MNRLHRLRLSHDPKAGVSALEKARGVARVVAPEHIVERLQRFEIKLLGFFIIADWNGYVFNHAPNIRVVGPISISKFRPYSELPAVFLQAVKPSTRGSALALVKICSGARDRDVRPILELG